MAAIIVRRVIAVLLAVLFLPALLLTLVYYRVNGTAASPDFYASQLRGADVYNYVHTDILPVAIDETHNQDVLVWKPVILKIARDTVPPDCLQARTEETIRATIPYLVGDTPSFRVVVPLKDRVQALGASVKTTLSQGSARSESQGVDVPGGQGDFLRIAGPVLHHQLRRR